MLLLQLSIILEFFNSLHVLLVLVNPRPANCDSLMELGQGSTSAISSQFPEACLKRMSSCDPSNISECYFRSFRGVTCLLRTILFSIFFDNFYNAFLQRRLVRIDGLDSVFQHSFLRCGQMDSVFCSLLRFSMNWTIHLPCFEASAVKAMRPILTREISSRKHNQEACYLAYLGAEGS